MGSFNPQKMRFPADYSPLIALSLWQAI
ncbi:hypothetical protein RCCS2_16851 [Roseobacter sp. CCS2]|nr:hypothetical protein RCCS2_16851 [Roseobacter sp. CCS2]